MKIASLRLKGFIGIKKGLGLNEITIDLSTLDGLIALSGPNGHGKSTVMDNLHPFRTLPSRDGALTQHVFLRDSEKEFIFIHDGHTYRTLIKIDGGMTSRSEGFIYKDGSDKSETNGKVKEYDRYIENLFGTPTLFFNSVFCAQNTDKISDLTTAELKKLFAEFLRLDRLVEFENTAKSCIGVLTGRADKIAQEIAHRAAEVGKKTDLEMDRTVLKNKWASALSCIAEVREQSERTTAEIDRLKVALASVTAQEQRIAGLVDAKTKAMAEFDAEQAKDSKTLDEIRERARAVDAECKRINATLADEGKINAASSEVANLDLAIADANKKLETLNAEMSAASKQGIATSAAMSEFEKRAAFDLAAIQKAITDIQAEKSRSETTVDKNRKALRDLETDHELKMLEHELKHAEEKCVDLEKRDPECQSLSCSFIVGAITAKARLPELKAAIETRKAFIQTGKSDLLYSIEEHEAALVALSNREDAAEAEYERTEKERNAERTRLSAELSKSHDEQDRLETEIESTKAKIAEIKVNRAEHITLSDRKSEIDVARSKLEDVTRRRAETFEEGGKLKAAMDEREKRQSARVSEIENQIAAIRGSIDAGATDKIKALENELETQKRSQAEKASELSEIDGSIKAIDIKIADVEKAQREMDEAKTRLDEVRKEISEWEYLKNACGKDGLRALEIDSVAPIITGYANDLLTATFGPNYTVKFRTQDEETGKETLDIIVIREDGTEVLLDNLSGGEKVWSLKALRLAMTLISKEKSGRNFQTVLADEEDGALDVENARHFINLYRSFMVEGGFEDCIFISHKPECVGMADHVIEFKKGRVSIQ